MHPLVGVEVPKNRVAVHWFGQSTFAVKSPGGTILHIDPYFPNTRPAEKYKHAQPPLVESELPVSGVLLTHDHSDHTHPESLARIHASFPKAVYAGPTESLKRVLDQKTGISESQFTVVNAGSTFTCGDFTAHFVYSKPPQGDPSAKIGPPDVTHLGFVLVCGNVRIYYTGDPIHTFADLPELTEPVKALKPEVGWFTCHPSEGEFPFFAGSVRHAQKTGVRVAFPSHYDCFAKRDYNPGEWAKGFAGTGIETRQVAYNQMTMVL